MSIVNSKIHDGVLMEENYISVPRVVFEELIRAETERDILEATLESTTSYITKEVLKVIKSARKNHLRGVMRIEIGVAPPTDLETGGEDTDTVAENEENADETEACK